MSANFNEFPSQSQTAPMNQNECISIGSFTVNGNFVIEEETRKLPNAELLQNLDHQINRRITSGIKQAMQLVLRKIDMMIEMKIGTLSNMQEERFNTLSKVQEERQEAFEAKLITKVIDLKSEFRKMQQQREQFYKQTLNLQRNSIGSD